MPDAAGVAYRQLKDANFALPRNDLVQRHGGIQEVNKQLEDHHDGIMSNIKKAGIVSGLGQRSRSLDAPIPRPRRCELAIDRWPQ